MAGSYKRTNYTYGLIFTLFKRHYCPICREKLIRKKWINQWKGKADRRQDMDYSINKVTNVRFLHYCRKCNKLHTCHEVYFNEKLN